MSQPTPSQPPVWGAPPPPRPGPPKSQTVLIWAIIIASIVLVMVVASLDDTSTTSPSASGTEVTTSPTINLPGDPVPNDPAPVEPAPVEPAPPVHAHDYWSRFACQRVSEVRAKAAAGLLTEQDAYDLLRDIHGDAVNSDNPAVAAAIEEVLRLHTLGGDSAAAGAALATACAGA
jgi:hypothetical protein